MPLPRFGRLPLERRRHILDTSRVMLAADGIETASYNEILRQAGISKASAYQYFDGRADLVATVVDDLMARLLASLGPWVPAADGPDFWTQVREGSRRLRDHLVADRHDLALLQQLAVRPIAGGPRQWTQDALADARRLGLIASPAPSPLLEAATLAVLSAVDEWMLTEHARTGTLPNDDAAWELLADLWATPRRRRARPPAVTGIRERL